MADEQTANSPSTLLQEVRASADWTRDVTGKFPDLPQAVRAHLEMVDDLLGRVGAALGELPQPNGATLPAEVRLHTTLLLNSLRLAGDHLELAEAVGQAHGVTAGLRIGKTISQDQHDQLLLQFKSVADARRVALDNPTGQSES